MVQAPNAEGSGVGQSDVDRLARAEGLIGYEFEDRAVLLRSLRHASSSESRLESNERLEFLGDAVLGMVACETIYDEFPDLLEGEMTKIKSVVVSRRTCAQLARSMKLAELLELGRGIEPERESLPQSMTAAAFEAIIAAVYLDGGFDAVRGWLSPLLRPLIVKTERCGHQQNYKSVLQQHVQQRLGTTPSYRILEATGPDHAKRFIVAVSIGDETYEPAGGPSKKQAEQAAALSALDALGLIERDDLPHPRTAQRS